MKINKNIFYHPYGRGLYDECRRNVRSICEGEAAARLPHLPFAQPRGSRSILRFRIFSSTTSKQLEKTKTRNRCLPRVKSNKLSSAEKSALWITDVSNRSEEIGKIDRTRFAQIPRSLLILSSLSRIFPRQGFKKRQV